MVCMKSSNGMIKRYSRSESAAAMPTGRAITTATSVAITTRVRVSIIGDHSPRFPINASPAAAPMARRGLESRQHRAATAMMNAHSGTHINISLSQPMPVCVTRERSEERRVGKECRPGGAPRPETGKKDKEHGERQTERQGTGET